MTTIRARCPDCGDVQLTAEEIIVVEDVYDQVQNGYRFTCPESGHTVFNSASQRIINLLKNGGVLVVKFDTSSLQVDKENHQTIEANHGPMDADAVLDTFEELSEIWDLSLFAYQALYNSLPRVKDQIDYDQIYDQEPQISLDIPQPTLFDE